MADGARGQLLHKVLENLAEEGIGERSLRQIAAGAGTSHRMLLYHFGSREGLLVAVAQAIEDQQRQALADLRAEGGEPRAVAWSFWRRLSDPALAPYERLFFELYGAALAGNEGARPLLDGVVEQWLEPLGALLAPDLEPDDPQRRLRARAMVSFARGVLLDLLATGERDELDKVVAEVIDRMTGAPE